MKASAVVALLAMFTIGWLGFSLMDYHLTTLNSDCGYAETESCTHYARSQQHMIIWRGLAVLLAAVLAALLVRKR